MPAILLANGKQQYFTTAGAPAVGYKLATFAAGTSTPQATWQDALKVAPNTNPIILDGRGEASVFWDGTYKVQFQDSTGAPIWTQDNLSAPQPFSLTQALVVANLIVIYPEKYGAVADGVTDCTAALLSAIAALSAGGVLELAPNGVYMVHVNGNHTLFFNNKSNFQIRGNNATIKAFNNDPCGANDEILFFSGCTDATIENLIVDGNLANRTPAISTTSNIDCRNGSARIAFRRVRSINAVMDGLALQTSTESVQSSYPADILFEDCEFNNAWRNGASIVASVRCTIRGGRAVNCGTTASGTAPRDGIDVEPNSTTTFANTDLVIDGVEVSGNAGVGLSFGGSTVNNTRLMVRNIRGNNNALGFINLSNATDFILDGVLCGPHATATRGLIDIAAGPLNDIVLRNISFAAQPALTSSNWLIFDHGDISGRYEVDGVSAASAACHAYNFNSRVTARNITAVSVTGDPAIQNGGTFSSFQNILVDSAGGRGFYTPTPVEIDGMKLFNCASTVGSAQFDTGSGNSIVKNVTVYQSVSIPGGAVGLFFNTVPLLVQNVLCFSAGTNYTPANSINFSAGTTGTQTRGLSPNPFSATATVAPGLLTNGTAANGTVAIPGAAFGDKVSAGPGADSQGMTYSVEVSSAGNVRWVISNTSGVSLTWVSSTWTFSIDKG